MSHPTEKDMSASTPKPPAEPLDEQLDEALEETFPASDPIAVDPPESKPQPPHDEKKTGDTHGHGHSRDKH
ncbi:hypothetical protein SAMN05445871_2241 [Paraburkholderia caballeronis]|nr:hypothetical protein SAMN05445871_2241 [Paraburkholderia caballeronis]